jgi:hypothetical protein
VTHAFTLRGQLFELAGCKKTCEPTEGIKMKKQDYYFVAVLLTIVLVASTAFATVGDVSALGVSHITIV